MADQPSLQEGGEHAPLDVVGGEAAPLDVGGEQGEGAGLPGAGAPDGGIGQGGAAGIGLGLPAAPADPAMMAVLQQLLASNHAIAARITCLEHSQAHRVSSQHVHGFLMGSRAVGNDQTAWRSNGTQKQKKTRKETIWTPEKEKSCCIRSPTFAQP